MTAAATASSSARPTEPPGEPLALPPSTMKAMLHRRYGGFDGLELCERPTPTQGDQEVLVRVAAAGLHVGDCFSVRGAPFAMRFVTGLFKPKVGVPGFDLAGTVVAVGTAVTDFKVGDLVFGATESGACAGYACVPQTTLALKPAALSFEAAAALPTSGLAALHALRDVAKISQGTKVLINGASGGVGSFAIQIAKSYGAHVTGVCSAGNADMVRSIGADRVIDYAQDDFCAGEPGYDLILDNIENRSLKDCRSALAKQGMLIVNSGTGAAGWRMMTRLIAPLILSPFVSQDLKRYLSMPNAKDLQVLSSMWAEGALQSVIDRRYTLAQTAEALSYIEQGHARGKVVVTMTEALSAPSV